MTTVILPAPNTYTLDASSIVAPDFSLVRGNLPPTLNPGAIERAIQKFILEVDTHGNTVGFFNQTLETIANATFLKTGGDFWLLEEDGEVVAYLIASISKDVDGTLCYWLSQAWVSPQYRGKPCVKEWYEKVREQAKKYLCRHIMIVSGRGAKAYCRWLGHGTHLYTAMLKEDLLPC